MSKWDAKKALEESNIVSKRKIAKISTENKIKRLNPGLGQGPLPAETIPSIRFGSQVDAKDPLMIMDQRKLIRDLIEIGKYELALQQPGAEGLASEIAKQAQEAEIPIGEFIPQYFQRYRKQ